MSDQDNGPRWTRGALGVLAFGVRVLGDRAEAEGVAQETLMRLWRIAPDGGQGEAKVTT